jgi:hypothetical protein
MKNIDLKRVGNKLTITVDLSAKGEQSKSGKSIVIASTKGNVKLPADAADKGQEIYVGLNIYKKLAK